MKVDLKKVEEILSRYDQAEHSLIAVLQDLQKEFNYLPQEALKLVSERLGVPYSQTYHVATFYKAFSLIPRGRHLITVCTGTACHVKGAPLILDALKRELGIGPGETTPDMEYTLETVNCLGSCALAPLVVIDGVYHGKMMGTKVLKLLKGKEGDASEES